MRVCMCVCELCMNVLLGGFAAALLMGEVGGRPGCFRVRNMYRGEHTIAWKRPNGMSSTTSSILLCILIPILRYERLCDSTLLNRLMQ